MILTYAIQLQIDMDAGMFCPALEETDCQVQKEEDQIQALISKVYIRSEPKKNIIIEGLTCKE